MYRRQVKQAHVDWIQAEIARITRGPDLPASDWMLNVLYAELARRA